MNPIWCPSIDDEMRGQMKNVIEHFPNMHGTALEGGKKQLGSFSAGDRLYIIAHGHSQMPVFSCDKKTWTAAQLVALLKSDGLPTTWRDIELLVCHAGESVNSTEIGNKLLGIRDKAAAAGGATDAMKQNFAATAAKGQAPSAFNSSDQLLPLAAQFAQALKSGGFTNFRVISYAAPVAQYFTSGGVTLDLSKKGGSWGVPIENCKDMIKVWL